MKPSKALRTYYEEGIARCESNLLTQTDPERRDIILRTIHRYKECIHKGIPQGENSVYANVQDDDTVQLSTGQGGL